MVKQNVIYLFITSVIVALSIVHSVALADVQSDLRQAEIYDKSGQDSEAVAAYTKIISDYPASEWAVKAQRGLATMYIIRGNYVKAKEAVDKLTVEFTGSPSVDEAIYRMGDMYRMMGKHQEAKELYRRVADEYRQGPYAIWGQMNVVVCEYYMGNGDDAQLEIDRLKENFVGATSLPIVLSVIGQECQKLKMYEKARGHFLYVRDTWPQHEYATWAQRNLVTLEIEAGNDLAAQIAFDKLLSEFSDVWGLPRAVYDISVIYRWKVKNSQKAEELCRYIVDRWTQTQNQTWVQVQCVAMANIDLSNDEAAQVAINTLIENFRQEPPVQRAVYEIAAECYYPQAEIYQKQGDANKANEYYQKAITILNRIIVDFPQGNYTPWAYDLTGRCYQNLDENDKAIEYFKKIVKDYPDYDYAWDAQFMIENRAKEMTSVNRNPR
jgi:tetratricopeptide (TPR) repeat protein